jgi:DNA-binding PucR family transcriptional regulator
MTSSGQFDSHQKKTTAVDHFRLLLRVLESGNADEFENLAREIRSSPKEDSSEILEDLEAVTKLHVRLLQLEQRERELLALFDITRDLVMMNDVDEVLRAICHHTRRLMSSDVAYLSWREGKGDGYFIRITEGTVTEQFQELHGITDSGIFGYVTRERRPFFTADYVMDDRFTHEGQIDEAVRGEQIVSILAVPLLVEGRVIGVLFAADRFKRSYSPTQISLLSSLAAHAALAIESARLFQENANAVVREREANSRLHRQSLDTQTAANAHDEFSLIIAHGGNLNDLAGAVAQELNGNVVVVDQNVQTIGMSDAGSASFSPDERRELLDALLLSSASGKSVPIDGDRHWRVAAATGAGALLGGVSIRSLGSLSAPRRRILERSAMVATIVLLAEERVRAAEHRKNADFVNELIRGWTADETVAIQETSRLGIDVYGGITIIVANAPGVSVIIATSQVHQNLPGLKVLIGERAGRLVLLLNAKATEDTALAIHQALEQRSTGQITLVYSEEVNTISGIPQSFDRIMRSVSLQLTLGRVRSVSSEAGLSLYSLMFGENGRRLLDAFVTDMVGPLIEYDQDRRAELIPTLLRYLDLGRDVNETARQMFIHPNTVRQRLKTASRLAPQIDDSNYLLEIHVALRLLVLKSGAAKANGDLPVSD